MLSDIYSFIVSATGGMVGLPPGFSAVFSVVFWIVVLFILPPRTKTGFYSNNLRGRLAPVLMVFLLPILIPYAVLLLWWQASKKVLAFIQD
jgi:hypothetical protein